MKLKPVSLGIAATLALTGPASAQDRLHTRDGAILEVKIKEVGTRSIIYKKWNNQDGPDFVMSKSQIDRIRFQNGDEETFGRREAARPVKARSSARQDYGKNILSFSPIHMTNTSPIGLSLSYERALDRNNILSFYLPVVYSFRNNDRDYYNYNTNNYQKDNSHMVWLYPGMKVYPTGSDGVVRYGVGPSLAFGSGERTYTRDVFDPAKNAYVTQEKSENVFVMGILVNNSLNIHPTPRLHIGLELGLGIPYYSDEATDNTSSPYNRYREEPLVQFNFNIGYRF